LNWLYLRLRLLSWILGVTRECPKFRGSIGMAGFELLRSTASSSRGAHGKECPVQCGTERLERLHALRRQEATLNAAKVDKARLGVCVHPED
jgi:hypothetical protein